MDTAMTHGQTPGQVILQWHVELGLTGGRTEVG